MRDKRIIFLILSVGLFVTYKLVFFERQTYLFKVQGRAEFFAANKKELGSSNFSAKPIKKSLIIAVNGKVRSLDSNVSIPINGLSKKKLTTYTNSDGIFKFHLKPGIYTFFIVKENNAYLNSFDGKGYFKSYKVFSDIEQILITVTSESYF